MNKYNHTITENSCFYQGNKEQLFSRKFDNTPLSFKVHSLFSDETNDDFNSEKYKKDFLSYMNPLIQRRIAEGGEFHLINPSDLLIKKVRLVDDDSFNYSGKYQIYPGHGICTKDYCHQYFELGQIRGCGHKDSDPWEQISFVAFCDECGRMLPLHIMSNLNNSCKCGGAYTKLKWGRKDSISSYKVECRACHDTTGLFFLKCNHTEIKNQRKRSSKPEIPFRGAPARANALLHPYVITMVDFAEEESVSDMNKTENAQFSGSFNYFFSENNENEAKISLSSFKLNLLKSDFFNLKGPARIFDEYQNYNDENANINNDNVFNYVVQETIKKAYKLSQGKSDNSIIRSDFGIDVLKNNFQLLEAVEFTESDLQGRLLSQSFSSSKSFNEYGLCKLVHFSDLSMVQVLLGIIEGSVRRNPVLFRPIESGFGDTKKPTVYYRKFKTEGLLFKLDSKLILKWLEVNGKASILNLPDSDAELFELLTKDSDCFDSVKVLVHTFSHILIQQSSANTGLDIQSLSEMIWPKFGQFFIYSTSSINIGGLEYVYNYQLNDWFNMVKEFSEDCPQDPGCMIDEGGACNCCSYLPEFVCCNFNSDLDRSSLIGGGGDDPKRFNVGYFDVID